MELAAIETNTIMMKNTVKLSVRWGILFGACCCAAGMAQQPTNANFYKESALFSTRPSETRSSQTIERFGPVGISIDLVQPAFVMKVGKVEAGSPAAATGKFVTGQIIEAINGQKLQDIDPRIQLGNIITEAEAKDG